MPAFFETGFVVRTPAWHGLATVLDEYPGSWAEARRLAGLDWEPVEAPSYGFQGVRADGSITWDPADAVTGTNVEDEGRRRIVRSDTGALLANVNKSYQVITHAEMGEIVEALETIPNVKYETTVVLNGGKNVAACIRLDEPVQIGPDTSQTLPYLAVTTAHDGSGSCRGQATSVRVVCFNTYSMAEAEAGRNGTVFTFRHSRGWRDHLEEARETIRGLRGEFADYVRFAQEMTAVKVTPAQEREFVVRFVPMPPDALISDRVARNVEESRAAVRSILDGPTTGPIRGTAFSLIQAAGEWADHYRRYRSLDSHFRRQLLRPEPLKVAARELALDVARS